MIDFRYHLVSIVAVFLALAIGIVLGSTELQGNTIDALRATSNSLSRQLSAAGAQRDAYQAQAGAEDQYLQSAEPRLLARLLEGQSVVILTEPGAQGSVVDGVKQAAAAAGATVTGQVALQPKFNDISAANQVLLAITQEFASGSAATLVAGGTAGSAQPGSAISVLRSSSVSGQVSTVDNADMTLGQISVIEALAAQLAGGKPNSYGISGASAVSPSPLPSPSATATASATSQPKTTGRVGKKK